MQFIVGRCKCTIANQTHITSTQSASPCVCNLTSTDTLSKGCGVHVWDCELLRCDQLHDASPHTAPLSKLVPYFALSDRCGGGGPLHSNKGVSDRAAGNAGDESCGMVSGVFKILVTATAW